MPYRKAILEAIEQLHDYHTRSSIEAIRKHVKASMPPDEWNYHVFLKTLQSIVQDGDLEVSNAHCELTSSFKKKRVQEIILSLEQTLRQENPSLVLENPFPSDPGSPKRQSHSQHKIAKQKSLERIKRNPMDLAAS